MKNLIYIPAALLLFAFGLIAGCDKEQGSGSLVDDQFLDGYWYDQEGGSMHFIHFYAAGQACFGYGCGLATTYDSFAYRISDNNLAIDLAGDGDDTESLHPLRIIDNRTMGIGNLSDIPENTDRIFKKLEIRNYMGLDSLELSVGEVYADAGNNLWLRLDSITSPLREQRGSSSMRAWRLHSYGIGHRTAPCSSGIEYMRRSGSFHKHGRLSPCKDVSPRGRLRLAKLAASSYD